MRLKIVLKSLIVAGLSSVLASAMFGITFVIALAGGMAGGRGRRAGQQGRYDHLRYRLFCRRISSLGVDRLFHLWSFRPCPTRRTDGWRNLLKNSPCQALPNHTVCDGGEYSDPYCRIAG